MTSSTGFKLVKSNHGYWIWTLVIGKRITEPDHDMAQPNEIVIWADSSDEHAEQNVNWEILDYTGSPITRGWSRSVRRAIRDLASKGWLK